MLDIPLFLLKDGIELLMDLNSVTKAFITSDGNLTYTISNVKYMCMMVTPHPDIQESYEAMWRSKKGLIYKTPSVRVKQQQQPHDASQHILQWHVGCRSAQRAVLKQSSSELYNYADYDHTAGHPLSLSEYQFFVGSLQYPHRAVTLDQCGQEAYMQLLQTFNRLGTSNIRMSLYHYFTPSRVSGTRIVPCQVTRYNAGAGLLNEPSRFYIGVKFNRVDGYGSDLTGIDLSHVPLETRLTRSAASNDLLGANAGANAVFTLFVWYDQYLKISSEQIATLS
jgi:hypothetical protein